MTGVFPCACKHGFQDAHYGHGNRVHNLAKKASVWRCTVCLRERSVSDRAAVAATTSKSAKAKSKDKGKKDRDRKSRETKRR
jgi:hypothetical protein